MRMRQLESACPQRDSEQKLAVSVDGDREAARPVLDDGVDHFAGGHVPQENLVRVSDRQGSSVRVPGDPTEPGRPQSGIIAQFRQNSAPIQIEDTDDGAVGVVLPPPSPGRSPARAARGACPR